MTILYEPARLGVIGVGHFGKALVKGIISSSYYTVKCSNLTPVTFEESSGYLETALSRVKVFTDNKILSEEVDSLLLTVRPQDMESVLEDIKEFKGLVITFAAGLPLAYYQERLPNASVVRAMTNLGVAYGHGMSAWVAAEGISDDLLIFTQSFFSDLGNHFQYKISDESNLDIVTAMSGSGLGFVGAILDIFNRWGEQQGLSREQSERVILETVNGLLRLYRSSDLSLEEIVSDVASEGGTTKAGLQAMLDSGLESAIFEGLNQTVSKCKELSDL